MEAADGDDRRSKRVRRAAEVACESTSSNQRTGSSTSGRPTSSELQEALTVIKQMKEADPPLLARRAPAKPNVVACAIALWRGEQFADDRAALRIFGAHPETKIREAWVSKLNEFAPAGFGTAGPAQPAYLLDPRAGRAANRRRHHDRRHLRRGRLRRGAHRLPILSAMRARALLPLRTLRI